MKRYIRSSYDSFNYRMLDRIISDLQYYVNTEGKTGNSLYYRNDLDKTVSYMYELYNSFPDKAKPEWFDENEIQKLVDKAYSFEG